MQPTDAAAFDKLLSGVFEIFNRKSPSPEARTVWWRILRPHPLETISQALGIYTRNHADFPPTPAAILELLGHGSGDNRPSADEAWAIALAARDEAETVVWTVETAQAFAAARPVLDLGDKIGARMAFKSAYDRLVTAARRENRPVAWQASLGWDADRRSTALEAAATAGLLPAPTVAAHLLSPADSSQVANANAADQIARLRQMLVNSPQTIAERASAAARERHADLLARHDAKVAQYEADRGETA